MDLEAIRFLQGKINYFSEIECKFYLQRTKTKVNYFSFLPPEILVQIFKYLNNKDLGNVKKVCKYTKDIIHTHLITHYYIRKPEINFRVEHNKGNVHITLQHITYKTREKFKNYIKRYNVTHFYDKRIASTEKVITNEVVKWWPNLEYLQLTNERTKQYKIMTENQLGRLVNLRYLKIDGEFKFTEKSLRKLVSLEELELRNGVSIRGLALLPKLRKLILHGSSKYNIPNYEIRQLTNLRSLSVYYPMLSGVNFIGYDDILFFKNLAELHLVMTFNGFNFYKLNEIFQSLTKLTKLELICGYIKRDFSRINMSKLTNLTELKLVGARDMDTESLLPLINLERLYLEYNNNTIVLNKILTTLTKLTIVGFMWTTLHKKPIVYKIDILKNHNFIKGKSIGGFYAYYKK